MRHVRDPAPRAPLRPLTLYTMLVLAYCAGLRLAEIVGLKLGDLDLNSDCIEVRDTKFFKSRRLPLSATAMAALRDYLKARAKAGAPTESDAPLFWHSKGGYGYVVTGAHLHRLIRVVGLKNATGRASARVHDLRHRADSPIMPTSPHGALVGGARGELGFGIIRGSLRRSAVDRRAGIVLV